MVNNSGSSLTSSERVGIGVGSAVGAIAIVAAVSVVVIIQRRKRRAAKVATIWNPHIGLGVGETITRPAELHAPRGMHELPARGLKEELGQIP